ncbi:TPR repeat protein [Pseudoduganella lurida]|uniref:TPR repeat protein n=2 Tax=Pseudoduganella lurida TaxID=1036180 RepID=A0A562QXA0_9BURK|nr:TPR repeat protein [Pseudoduganella lurida]
MAKISNPELPRNQSIDFFNPHMKSFVCNKEVDHLPPVDAQADRWLAEAISLEDPEIYFDDRDYKRIVELTKRAADRKYWKAMLNLASFYIEGYDPPHGAEDAVKIVEAAMLSGIPAAFERMGTYYMNGTGVRADATKAYAFLQKAALMGDPSAQAYLGDRLGAVSDDNLPGYWANIPVAVKMLECSVSQGYGPAAHALHYMYLEPPLPDGKTFGPVTPETRKKALHILHEGVKYGCSTCAGKLFIEFDHPRNLSEMVVPFADKARGERYRMLADALEFNPRFRFPNLDKILPLPPAIIPTWNGDRDTLLEAAMGAKLKPRPVRPEAVPEKTGRQALDSAYRLRGSGEQTAAKRAPFAGYWQPTTTVDSEQLQRKVAAIAPGLYEKGEPFQIIYSDEGVRPLPLESLVWKHWLTIDHDYPAVRIHAADGLTRMVPHAEPLMQCAAETKCPATGIWQPWIDPEHPLHAIINQHWRQSWITEGQRFPDPKQAWLLDLPANLVTWHLMDADGVDINRDIDAQSAGGAG